MSSSSRWGTSAESQATAATAKQISQNALKLKAMSQLRQVLRSSSNRGALAFALGKDLLIVLRYLPVGIMNKMQQFTGDSRSSSTSSSSSITTTSTSTSNAAVEKRTTEDKKLPLKTVQEDKDHYENAMFNMLNATSNTSHSYVPGSPSKTPQQPVPKPFVDHSVLKNVIEISTANNRVIDPKKRVDLSISSTAAAVSITDVGVDPGNKASSNKTSSATAGQEAPSPKKDGKSDKTVPASRFFETNMQWENIESRTKYLVTSLMKDVSKGTASKHNLMTHLDELFSHIYQHVETRNTAIETGALKVLNKVVKLHDQDTYIINRTREIAALLGSNPSTKGKGIKILSIDGGGVRGLVAIEVLRSIERLTGKRIHELFDYICGVSTGSILAFLLGAHKRSLDEAEALYKDLSREIFQQNSFFGNATLLWNHSYYHTPTFEKILKNHCGELPLIALARNPELPRVSAISTVVNQERVCPYVFRTYALPPTVKAKYIGGCRYHMWEAVRASAAAPTYFEEFKLGNYLHQDGGILVNNPTSVAISEAKTLWKDQPLQCVVSLGTGLTLSSRTDKNLNDLIEVGKGGESYLSWKGKFLKVLDSATDTESVHNTLNELIPHDIYFRFNPYMSEVVRLDENRPEKLDSVQAETRAYLERNVEKVQFACETLVQEKSLSKKFTDWWYYP